jgi:hypothetical protein
MKHAGGHQACRRRAGRGPQAARPVGAVHGPLPRRVHRPTRRRWNGCGPRAAAGPARRSSGRAAITWRTSCSTCTVRRRRSVWCSTRRIAAGWPAGSATSWPAGPPRRSARPTRTAGPATTLWRSRPRSRLPPGLDRARCARRRRHRGSTRMPDSWVTSTGLLGADDEPKATERAWKLAGVVARGLAAAETRGSVVDDRTRVGDRQPLARRPHRRPGHLCEHRCDHMHPRRRDPPRSRRVRAWDNDELAALEEYAVANGERGPQPSWPAVPRQDHASASRRRRPTSRSCATHG